MKKWNRYIFYLIGATLLLTVAVQSYWNYKNYQQNKRQLIREIRRSFNDAIQEYYAIEMKKHTVSAVGKNLTVISTRLKQEGIYTSLPSEIKSIKIKKSKKEVTEKSTTSVMLFKGQIPDSIKIRKNISSIIVSITTDSINFQQMDSLFKAQLLAKDISLIYGFQHWKKKELLYESNKELVKGGNELRANSTFLKARRTIAFTLQSANKGNSIAKSMGHFIFSVFGLGNFRKFMVFALHYSAAKASFRDEKRFD
ncbi:MAG: hypothetical protein CSA94_01620 [Bacteroidetes bacterium]|nr:MAG: hypothetical protein CSA94_01620 [Bacteroidota bacterium]